MDTYALPDAAPAAPAGTAAGAHDGTWTVTADVAALRTAIANLFFYGIPGAGDREWVLVDAGIPGSAAWIESAAKARYGAGSRPSCIVLTHGHFDHVGALHTLAELWDVPIFAHPLEFPYLDGRESYPPPDPTVGGGAMARMSPLYPRGPYDFSPRLRALPADGSVPGMPGWRWVFTPGHSPGHVALFRDSDRTLLAGDAFVTTKQESMTAVLQWRPEVNGPPAYFTQDWTAARRSVEALAALEPDAVGTGHGPPLHGDEMRAALRTLARDFDLIALPEDGRYVRTPAVFDEQGVVSVPPPVLDPVTMILGLGLVALAGVAIGTALNNRRS
jgi:glyoxylase-like metal-dependent hydrolase (beta-lactamase superfamily II)